MLSRQNLYSPIFNVFKDSSIKWHNFYQGIILILKSIIGENISMFFAKRIQ